MHLSRCFGFSKAGRRVQSKRPKRKKYKCATILYINLDENGLRGGYLDFVSKTVPSASISSVYVMPVRGAMGVS